MNKQKLMYYGSKQKKNLRVVYPGCECYCRQTYLKSYDHKYIYYIHIYAARSSAIERVLPKGEAQTTCSGPDNALVQYACDGSEIKSVLLPDQKLTFRETRAVSLCSTSEAAVSMAADTASQ
jgi:hypothetical protein